MKTSLATLMLLLAAAAFFSPCQAQEDTNASFCCVRYIEKPVPLRVIETFYYSNSRCPMPAIILISKSGRRICADPRSPWVQDIIARPPKD